MRISELSRLTGVPVPTIKYYQREGLLPHGERTSQNQARYTDEHARRLRLVRALVEVARLPIATARTVLAAVAEPSTDLFAALGKVHYAVTAVPPAIEPSDTLVAELVDRLGWTVKEANPSRQALANLLEVLQSLGQTGMLDRLDDYAAAAAQLAAVDISIMDGHGSQDEVLETAVIATLLGDVLVSLLRRMAQESNSTKYRARQSATDGA